MTYQNARKGTLFVYFLQQNIYYLYDFVVRDIKIAVYMELPRKINFNLVSENFSKNGF